MNRIVQHIKMDMPSFTKQELYCYGEASFEENQAMQEPLEKLYKYENQPDMREKVREYISELDNEIDRCNHEMEELSRNESFEGENNIKINYCIVRAKTIMQIQNDLQSRLEELI